jgi:AcrR family transcriptional regulator
MTTRATSDRRARVREHARRDILESAAQVFARRGYASATLAELAEAAGYAAPSLYRYFGSKEEIFQSLLSLVTAELQEVFDAPVDRRLPIEERLSTLFLALRRMAEGRRETLELLTAHTDPDEGQAHLEGRLETWLKKHVARSELRVSPALAAQVAAGILLAQKHGRQRPGSTNVESARLAADLILHGVSA